MKYQVKTIPSRIKKIKKIKIEEEENCLVPVHCHTNSEGLQGMLILCLNSCVSMDVLTTL